MKSIKIVEEAHFKQDNHLHDLEKEGSRVNQHPQDDEKEQWEI